MFVWIVESKNSDGEWTTFDNNAYASRKFARQEKQTLKEWYPDTKFRIRKYVREEE